MFFFHTVKLIGFKKVFTYEIKSFYPCFLQPFLVSKKTTCGFSSVQFSRSVVSDSLRPHEPQHARPPCPSPTPGVCSNWCPLSRWCHPTISSSCFNLCQHEGLFQGVRLFLLLQSFPAWRSFPRSQIFTSGGQRIGVSASASVLQMNIQDWFPLAWTGFIPLQSKDKKLSRVSSNNTVQKHQFFSPQFSLVQLSHPYMTTGETITLTRWTFVGN